MGFDKLAANLLGTSVLQRTLEQLHACPSICELIVVCPQPRWETIDLRRFTKAVKRVDGGKERQDSVAAGLAAIGLEHRWVAVHDGARPLIASSDINRCLAAAQAHRAASLARRVTETLKRTTPEDHCKESINRENLWFMETPQIAETQLLRNAFEHITTAGIHVTDEVSAVAHIGISAMLVESSQPNLKITTPADLILAAALLSS